MSPSQRDMRDVVLHDDPDSPGPDDPVPPVGAPPRRVVLTPGRRWALGAVLVVAVTVAAVLDARRTDAELVDLRGLPGVLAPLDGPVQELWRADGVFLWQSTRVDGLLVGPAQSDLGRVDAIGLAEVTGAVVWRTPLVTEGERAGGATCAVPDAEESGTAPDGATPPPPGATGARERVMTCVVVSAEPADTGGPAATFQPSAARLLVLDATTGTVLREEPTVPTTAVAALGADLVLSHLDDDGRLVVRRTDAGAEQERWSFVSPDALSPGTSGRWASVAVQDDLVVAGGDSGWVLSVDGRELHRWQPSPTGAGWLDLLPGGLVVEAGEPGDATTRILDPRASSAFTVDGRPLPMPVDDGSAGDIVLARTVADQLTAYDASSGRPRWTLPEAGAITAGPLVDGRIVVTRADGLAALSAGAGRLLWQVDVALDGQFPVLTDGRLLLCVVADPDRGTVLAAYGIDDGRLQWEVDLPEDVHHLRAEEGRLLGYTGDATTQGLVAFG